MNIQFTKKILKIVIILSVATSIVQADQNVSLSGSQNPKEAISSKLVINGLHLNAYEAVVTGNMSICADDNYCSANASDIKSWVCALDVCWDKNSSKDAVTCFPQLDKSSVKKRIQISSVMCPAITSTDVNSKKVLLAQIPELTEDDFVESRAYLLALKESATACESYIKNYVGAYGSQWTFDWLRALAGCRILSHASVREQEEKNFYLWFQTFNGAAKCSDITNNELSQACSTAGTKPF